MAETENKEQSPQAAAEKTEENTNTKKTGGMPGWIIIAAAVIVSTVAGAGLGFVFAGSKSHAEEPNQAAQTKESDQKKPEEPNLAGTEAGKSWYFDFEPAVANLNEPGATRYIRVTLTLQINGQIDQQKGKEFLNTKKPVLANGLTIYLSSLSLQEVTGEKNLRHIQAQLLDNFNQALSSDGKPMIEQILFKEFAIQ